MEFTLGRDRLSKNSITIFSRKEKEENEFEGEKKENACLRESNVL